MGLMVNQNFDWLGYALLDFETQTFESFCVLCDQEGHPTIYDDFPVYFDLASLTKPLTLSAVFHRNPELFSESERLLVEHSGGLPAWALLSHSTWREDILRFKIEPSEVRYSDCSALRLMLELEKKGDRNFKEMCDFYWDGELCFWRDLPVKGIFPATGYRHGKLISGEVNDPNAWNLGEFCSHAGLFSTVGGLARSLFSLDGETHFVEQMKGAFDGLGRKRRFLHGWDTIRESDSLAGSGCGEKTFGHLGFTGTSIWIDSEKRKGQILLTNACHPWQHARSGLTDLRRNLGTQGWMERPILQ